MTPTDFSNPVCPMYLADPFCFLREGVYYAVGTGVTETVEAGLGSKIIPMIKSVDLQHWEEVGPVLEPPSEERGGSFWAPEVAYHEGVFHLYYHASGNGLGFRIRVATSRALEGPYVDTGMPMTDVTSNPFAIDSTAFRDDDGQWYLFYATDFYDSDATDFRGTALVVTGVAIKKFQRLVPDDLEFPEWHHAHNTGNLTNQTRPFFRGALDF